MIIQFVPIGECCPLTPGRPFMPQREPWHWLMLWAAPSASKGAERLHGGGHALDVSPSKWQSWGCTQCPWSMGYKLHWATDLHPGSFRAPFQLHHVWSQPSRIFLDRWLLPPGPWGRWEGNDLTLLATAAKSWNKLQNLRTGGKKMWCSCLLAPGFRQQHFWAFLCNAKHEKCCLKREKKQKWSFFCSTRTSGIRAQREEQPRP